VEPGDGALVTARGIVKAFGPTRALDGADLTVRAGEVHALLGENGAGKSTLIKALVGVHRPDRGTLEFAGEPLELRGVGDGLAHGIAPVYQQLSLLPHLTVRENLAAFDLAAGAGWRPARRSPADAARAGDALRLVGLAIDVETLVEELSLAERQLVEIARAVLRDCRLLILDEPTTSLGGHEIEHLFGVMRRLTAAGGSVLFISHRLDEVAEISDTLTVLRNGRTVIDAAPTGSLSRQEIVDAMAGEAVSFGALARREVGEVVVQASGLRVDGLGEPLDITVREGEIVACVGLIGSGAIRVAETLAGLHPVRGGEVRVGGRPLSLGDRATAVASGVGLIPGDRERDGLFPTLNVLQNASASLLPALSRRGLVDRPEERRRLGERLRALSVRPDDPGAAITALSGGNQQKVVVARSLAAESGRVLVAIEPTAGVDVAARHDIHSAVLEAAARGVGVLLASTDLDEVVALSHRIIVMRRGAIVAEFEPGADVARIVAALTGVDEVAA
jgi:ABC-type sugar transport system ATPase subunit